MDGLPTCDGRAVYEDKIRNRVWFRVVAYLTEDDLLEREAARLQRDRPGEALHRESLAACERDASEIDRKRKNIVAQIADEDDPEVRSLFREKLDSLKRERDGIERRASRLRGKIASYDLMDKRIDELKAKRDEIKACLSDADTMTWEQRRVFLDWLGVVVVGNGEEFDVMIGEEGEEEEDPVAVSSTPSGRSRGRPAFP